MTKYRRKTLLTIGIIVCLLLPSLPLGLGEPQNKSLTDIVILHTITKEYVFSQPTVITENNTIYVHLTQSDLSQMTPGYPIIPVNLTVLELPFGSQIQSINYDPPEVKIINLSGLSLALASLSLPDSIQSNTSLSPLTPNPTEMIDPFPVDWISYHTGGGLSQGNHTTFFVLRVYPVRYFPSLNQLEFVNHLTVRITVQLPVYPLLENRDVYDLLILAPDEFLKELRPLVSHKNTHGVKTNLVGLSEIYNQMAEHGRDNAEKIKLFIKKAIDDWGVTHVLLVGGIKHQGFSWYFPVRYSHVVPDEGQEYAEQSFLSDLYFADIFDSSGNFSSWDSNGNNVFAEWMVAGRDNMDLYPDVYLGRLPCINREEVRVMVKKIIQYEDNTRGSDWFSKMVFVAGDSYNDTHHYNEGELISAKVATYMPGFTPVNVFASIDDINRKTVNTAMNQGCGFVYFVGHGNPQSWNTHFPPNGTEWCTGYTTRDMIYLKNKEKLPVVVVGGCHNGQFDTTMRNILLGLQEEGLKYFSRKTGAIGGFWYNEWIPNCWGWLLTRKIGGGSIATISNTGLGTHGDGDNDHNGVPDYFEVLDGWLEIRFFQHHGEQHQSILGQIHGDTISEYLHRFLGNQDKMDVKMVQQWELFGDPSMVIGGFAQ